MGVGVSDRGVKLTTHLYLVLMLGMNRAITQLLPVCLHHVDSEDFVFI